MIALTNAINALIFQTINFFNRTIKSNRSWRYVTLPSKKAKLFDFSSDTDDETEATDSDVHSAVERYKAEPELDQDACPLQWWISHKASHPTVAKLAAKFLSAPATTVPCERLFSAAGHILDKKRASLSSSNLNKLLCLHNWLNEWIDKLDRFVMCDWLTWTLSF